VREGGREGVGGGREGLWPQAAPCHAQVVTVVLSINISCCSCLPLSVSWMLIAFPWLPGCLVGWSGSAGF
jgi:hypothetical protein